MAEREKTVTAAAATLKAGGRSGESAEQRGRLFHCEACQRRKGFESRRSAENVIADEGEEI